MTKTRLEKIIYSFHHPRSLTTGRRVRTRESLGDYIARFTREMEEGTRLNIHKLRYGPSTIKNYKGFVVQFDEYCKAKRKQFDFADIDLKFYDDFVAWFTAKNYSVNTIGRHVKELKIIMRAAREEGLHDNGAIESRKFRVLTADVENIYLTESEIRAIAALDLSKNWHKDVARDIFLVGCYTAQRFSDYSTINEGNIRTLENGQQVIDLKQQKTGNHVVIPVRPELQAILEKYDNRLPRTYEQKVNHLIKEIAREAGITEKVEVSYIENGEKKSRLVEKCDLVKTHTARRSGATNMYLAGIPTIAIMKVTGHKTEREFMKYIKITEEQTALELMSHPYFRGQATQHDNLKECCPGIFLTLLKQTDAMKDDTQELTLFDNYDFIEKIESLMADCESAEVEFKSARGGFPGSLWETYSAFANTQGGVIVLGVKEKDGKFTLDGITLEQARKYKKEFWDNVNNKAHCSANVLQEKDVQDGEYNGSYVLVFNVPRAPRNKIPVYLHNNPENTFKRNYEGDYRCDASEIQRMFADADITEHPRDYKFCPNLPSSRILTRQLLSNTAGWSQPKAPIIRGCCWTTNSS